MFRHWMSNIWPHCSSLAVFTDISSVPQRRTVTSQPLISSLSSRGGRGARGEARTLLSRRGNTHFVTHTHTQRINSSQSKGNDEAVYWSVVSREQHTHGHRNYGDDDFNRDDVGSNGSSWSLTACLFSGTYSRGGRGGAMGRGGMA